MLPRDEPLAILLPKINAILDADPNALVFLKWTCPGCGDRVTASEPNKIFTGGYLHDDCGVTYKGDEFGFMFMSGDPNILKGTNHE